jgi:hypothetical protein
VEGVWTFEITVRGKVSALGIKIKNNPGAGDVCWSYYQKSPISGFTAVETEFDKPIAAASEGICGSQFEDINGDPLTVYAYTQGGKSANVTIDVFPPLQDEAVGVGTSQTGNVPSTYHGADYIAPRESLLPAVVYSSRNRGQQSRSALHHLTGSGFSPTLVYEKPRMRWELGRGNSHRGIPLGLFMGDLYLRGSPASAQFQSSTLGCDWRTPLALF